MGQYRWPPNAETDARSIYRARPVHAEFGKCGASRAPIPIMRSSMDVGAHEKARIKESDDQPKAARSLASRRR